MAGTRFPASAWRRERWGEGASGSASSAPLCGALRPIGVAVASEESCTSSPPHWHVGCFHWRYERG